MTPGQRCVKKKGTEEETAGCPTFGRNLFWGLFGVDAKFQVRLGRATGIQINTNQITEQESDDHMTHEETELEPHDETHTPCRAKYKTRNLFEVLKSGFWPPTGLLCVHLFTHYGVKLSFPLRLSPFPYFPSINDRCLIVPRPCQTQVSRTLKLLVSRR